MTLSEGQRSLGCNYGARFCRGTERVKNLLGTLLGVSLPFSSMGILKFKFLEVFLKHDALIQINLFSHISSQKGCSDQSK